MISLIQSHVKDVNVLASCHIHENEEGDLVLLAKDFNTLSINLPEKYPEMI